MRRLLVPAISVALLVGPAAVPLAAANREHQQMMADIRMLQEHALRLQLALGTLADTLKTVAAKLDEQAGINRKAFADARLLVDNVAGDVRIVREKLDDTNVRISSLSQEVEALRLAIPPPLPVSSAPAVDPVTGLPVEPVPAPGPAGPVPAAPLNPGISPDRLFQSAWADYTIGQWAMAIAGFESYIKTFPKSPRAADAQYYIGQTYYNDGRFEQAVAAFNRVIADYPTADVVPEAYYKRGLCLERLGQTDRARESYEYVIQHFPTHSAAGLAKQVLDRLSRPR